MLFPPLPHKISDQNTFGISNLSVCPSYFLWFNNTNILWKTEAMKIFGIKFSPASYDILLLRKSTLLHTLLEIYI